MNTIIKKMLRDYSMNASKTDGACGQPRIFRQSLAQFPGFLLVNNENAYSRACEIRGEIKGSINEVARHDFAIMKELFDFDLSVLGNYFSVDCMDALLHYE